jgi:hypothetical protein
MYQAWNIVALKIQHEYFARQTKFLYNLNIWHIFLFVFDTNIIII